MALIEPRWRLQDMECARKAVEPSSVEVLEECRLEVATSA